MWKPKLTNGTQRFGQFLHKVFQKTRWLSKFHSKKNTHQSFTAPQNVKVANNKVYLPKFVKDGIKTKLHRANPDDAILKQATISRQNNQYFISILIDDNVPIPKPIKAKTAVGLDMCITHQLITSDGVKYPNEKHYAKHMKKRFEIYCKTNKNVSKNYF
jgi:putative transposase